MNGTGFVFLFVVLLSVLLAVVFFRGRGAWLIAGYNTAGPAERARYDEKKLCRFVGLLMLVMAACFAVAAAGAFMESERTIKASMIVFLVVILAGVIFANTKGRFKKQ